MNNIETVANLDSWKVESMRLTAFHKNFIQTENLKWWEDLIRNKPESRTFFPKDDSLLVEGLFESEKNGKLTLKANPNRNDWSITSYEEKILRDLPQIGDFPKVVEIFFGKMKEWFEKESSLEIRRLAFGTVVWQLAENQQDAYEKISNFLPCVTLEPEKSKDFLYQINRPKISELIPDLTINRLSRWSVGKFQKLHIKLGQQGLSEKKDSFVSRLELDINTDQNYQEKLPNEKLFKIFEELERFGEEIAQKGDQP